MNAYHLIWADYDGVKGEAFTSKEELEKRYTEIAEKSEQYGTHIIGVYFGHWVELMPTEVKTVYRVKE